MFKKVAKAENTFFFIPKGVYDIVSSIGDGQLAVRAFPDWQSPIVGHISVGSSTVLTGLVRIDKTGYEYCALASGLGWVSHSFVRLLKEMDEVDAHDPLGRIRDADRFSLEGMARGQAKKQHDAMQYADRAGKNAHEDKKYVKERVKERERIIAENVLLIAAVGFEKATKLVARGESPLSIEAPIVNDILRSYLGPTRLRKVLK